MVTPGRGPIDHKYLQMVGLVAGINQKSIGQRATGLGDLVAGYQPAVLDLARPGPEIVAVGLLGVCKCQQ